MEGDGDGTNWLTMEKERERERERACTLGSTTGPDSVRLVADMLEDTSIY